MNPDRFVGIFSTIMGMLSTFVLCWIYYDNKIQNFKRDIKFYQDLIEQYKRKYVRGYPQN
jgi:hypothetical protein